MFKFLIAALALITLPGCAMLDTPVPKDWRYKPGKGFVSSNPKDFNYIGNSTKSYRRR